MKNIMLSTAVIGLLSLSTTGHARDLNQGTIEIGGDLDLSMVSLEVKPEGGDKVETDTTTLSASALYYVVQNVGVGITWDYMSDEAKVAGDKAETTTNMIGPTAAYNISLNDKTSLKVLGAVVMSSTELSGTSISTTKIDGFGWTIGGQLSYFLNDFVSLNGSLQYLSLSLEEDDTKTDVDTTGFGAGVGLSVYLK